MFCLVSIGAVVVAAATAAAAAAAVKTKHVQDGRTAVVGSGGDTVGREVGVGLEQEGQGGQFVDRRGTNAVGRQGRVENRQRNPTNRAMAGAYRVTRLWPIPT